MAFPIIKLGSVANLFTKQMHFLKAGDINWPTKPQAVWVKI